MMDIEAWLAELANAEVQFPGEQPNSVAGRVDYAGSIGVLKSSDLFSGREKHRVGSRIDDACSAWLFGSDISGWPGYTTGRVVYDDWADTRPRPDAMAIGWEWRSDDNSIDPLILTYAGCVDQMLALFRRWEKQHAAQN